MAGIAFARRDLPSLRAMVRRIVRTYDASPFYVREQGRAWYPRALQTAGDIADVLPAPHSPVKAAGMLAAMAPRVSWSRAVLCTVRLARHGIGADVSGVLRSNVRNALQIRDGMHPNDVLRGRKSFSFYRNIIGDVDAVTVDVWALRVALGDTPAAAPSPAAYDVIADAYRAAARIVGETPRDVQAITWTQVRGRAD